MGQSAIQVENLSKRYRIGAAQESVMFREALVRMLTGPFRRRQSEENHVWALRDLDLEIGRDEVVGVIGRNGSGKTTLLKLLSRITYPTSGKVSVQGRVASLVEVGTGFHNELTGRENVFLNGSILGLKRRQIQEHFDAIVEFSGVGKFIDTPIKRYSTGMRLRLGFAVAAHLFPDVLLVDEVLAVGDVEFQNKCLDTLNEVGNQGNTVLLVSHNLEAIERLCPRTIWIDQGKLRADGKSRDIIKSYLAEADAVHRSSINLSDSERRSGTGEAHFTGIEFLDETNEPKDVVRGGDTLTIRLHYQVDTSIKAPYFGVVINTEFGAILAHPNSWSSELEIPALDPGKGAVELQIRDLNLMPGTYPLTLWMNRHSDSGSIDYLEHCAVLTVHAPEDSRAGRLLERRGGAVYFDSRWQRIL